MSFNGVYNDKGSLRIKEPSAIPISLFKCQIGPVRAEVYGPPGGGKWRSIKYYRLIPNTRGDAGKWKQVDANRPADQKNLLKCVKAVTAWQESSRLI